MIISLLPFMDVIGQIKGHTFSVSMESQAVKLGYLSTTQNIANQKQLQNNHRESLQLTSRNKHLQMKKNSKLKPTCQILTSDGLFMPHYAWLGSQSDCCLSRSFASKKKNQVKMTSQNLNCSTKIYRITTQVYDFNCNHTSAYHKDEHQKRSVRHRGIQLRFESVHHIFIILLKPAKRSYDPSYAPVYLNYICHLFCLIQCKLSLYFLYMQPPKTNNKFKGNKTTNSKRKNICISSNNMGMGKSSSDMFSMCISPCTAGKMRTVNICIFLTLHIISFPTVKELLDTVLAVNSKANKELLELICLEAYVLPVTENIYDQGVTLHIHNVKIVYYNGCYTASSLIKKTCKSKP